MAERAEIKLSNTDRVAIVSEEDFERINKYHWYLSKRGYAETHNPETKKKLAMHRIVLYAKEGEMIDHKNCNKLDNRRENLRYATKSENRMNCPSTSEHRGVSYHKQTGRWQAYIKKDGKQIFLGLFDDIQSAKETRKNAEIELYGEYRYIADEQMEAEPWE